MKPPIVHFAHPGHLLTEVYGSEEFHCNGCEIPGYGPRYRCHDCDFNLHKYCGVCPSTLSTFMHPQHQLKLNRNPRDFNRRICDLCGDAVEGLFYQCTVCDFNIHPLCTNLRQDVSHPLHPTCPLKLRRTSSGCCRVCKLSQCCTTSWVYGCRVCGFDIHLGCVLAPGDSPTTSRSVEAPFPPPPLHPPNWGVYYGGMGMPPHYYGYGSPYSAQYYSSIPPMYTWPTFNPFSAYAYHPPPPPATPSFDLPPPSSGFSSHGFGPHNTNNYQAGQGGGQPSKWKLSRIISALIGQLSMGVFCNVIADGITS